MNVHISARYLFLIGAVLIGQAGPLQAATPGSAAAGSCSVKSRSERVVIVVCPRGATQDVLRAAGVAACQGYTGSCNAWIWDDADKAPDKAPAVDADLPKATAGSARAVWLHDVQGLMEMRKTR